jgi:hypothetical protein
MPVFAFFMFVLFVFSSTKKGTIGAFEHFDRNMISFHVPFSVARKSKLFGAIGTLKFFFDMDISFVRGDTISVN